MTIKSWFDRLLGRGGQSESDADATRASMRAEEPAVRAPERADDLEEGMHASRDEAIDRHEADAAARHGLERPAFHSGGAARSAAPPLGCAHRGAPP